MRFSIYNDARTAGSSVVIRESSVLSLLTHPLNACQTWISPRQAKPRPPQTEHKFRGVLKPDIGEDIPPCYTCMHTCNTSDDTFNSTHVQLRIGNSTRKHIPLMTKHCRWICCWIRCWNHCWPLAPWPLAPWPLTSQPIVEKSTAFWMTNNTTRVNVIRLMSCSKAAAARRQGWDCNSTIRDTDLCTVQGTVQSSAACYQCSRFQVVSNHSRHAMLFWLWPCFSDNVSVNAGTMLLKIHRSCGSDLILIEIHVLHATAARLMRLRQETWSGKPDTGQVFF